MGRSETAKGRSKGQMPRAETCGRSRGRSKGQRPVAEDKGRDKGQKQRAGVKGRKDMCVAVQANTARLDMSETQ